MKVEIRFWKQNAIWENNGKMGCGKLKWCSSGSI